MGGIYRMNNKERIESLLWKTNRAGVNNLIQWMRDNGFYNAPCSTQHHLSNEGGLAEHSLNVYKTMTDMVSNTALFGSLEEPNESIIIASLLHDLGKAGQFGKPNYIENMISDRKGGFKQSDKKPFEINKELLTVPHEVRSIQIAMQFIDLTEEENWAILMHNGLYGDFKYSIQGKETPLYMLLHFADMWASRVIEKEE